MTTSTRIAALGSFTAGDNVAWMLSTNLAYELRKQGVDENRYTIVQYRRPTDLLHNLNAYDQLILLDAYMPNAFIAGEKDPDIIRISIPDEMHKLKMSSSEYSSHGFDITSVIRLAKSMGSLPACVVIYGINSRATINQALTEQVALSIQEDLKQGLCV